MESPSDITALQQEKLSIKEDEQIILGKRVVYRLYRSGGSVPLYEMEIATPDERESVPLGNNLGQAMDIYSAVFKGEVTPCTLKYIVYDCFS